MNSRFIDFRIPNSKRLFLFFRKNSPLPDELYSFNVFAEKYIYRSLTIGEAEQLYGNR